ncbi:tail fiber domain-containing protein [uncultured Chryseobacterium sp.]|uniref:tail fiber domain-containing protein n=1 Tax=uncultured Chryseobacterium sp. TaxID=259322 RepID=UPI0025FBD9FE|nr:tail fiber domain-containing protein [uncultured Chryseobacterium sp.]
MKKNILTVAALVVFAGMQAQIQTNNGVTNGITNSNVLLDGSSGFSTEAGAGPYVGKGVVIPSVDLVNFQFDLSQADGFTFPTYFDGMIVYNNATGNTLTTGNRPSTSLAVTPGFYYFYNPNGASNGNITGGQWKALGGTATGDNLGNHSATQTLALNGFDLRLKGAADGNQALAYNAAIDGPRLWGNSGGALGTINGTSALTWDNSGNVTSPGVIKSGIGSIGSASLIPGSATLNGYISLTKPDQSPLVNIGGFSGGDVAYNAPAGKHVFNTTVKSGYDTIGSALLVPGSNTYNGYLSITKPDQSTLVNIGGFSGGDVAYNAPSGIHIFNTTVKSGYETIGSALLIPGSATYNGYVSITKPDQSTLVNIGGSTGGDVSYNAPSGKHVFNTIVKSGYETIGSALLIPGSSTYNGYLSLTKPDQSPLVNIGGFTGGDVAYTAPSGKHVFNTTVKSGYETIGSALLVPGSSTYNGYLSLTKPDQSTLVNIGGFSGGDVAYTAPSGKHIFNTTVKSGYETIGSALLVPGSNTYNGYLSLTKPDQSILINIGGFSGGDVAYNAPSGIHVFNTTIQTPRVQGPSDRRFKKDITPIYNATEKLNQLNGYTYTWKDKKEFPGQTLGTGKDMGVIAQEVEKVFPDAVMTNKEGYKSVNYNALIPVLIESLKEAHREIKELKEELKKK